MNDPKTELKLRCDKMMIKLNELKAQFDSTTCQNEPGNEDPVKADLQERERQMKDEIELLTEDLNETGLELPSHSLLLQEIVKDDLKQDTKQLEDLLLILCSSCEQLRGDIMEAENVQQSLDCLRSSLENKVRLVEEVKKNATELNSLGKVLDKKTKLERLCMTRSNQMAAFIQQHYPPLTQETVQNWHKKHGKARSKMPLASSFMNLETILELLMNKCKTTPNDSYIVTDDSYWPPYIEMMLRCGIVQRHPDNPVQIKLIPFHL